jgi:hypothetical protein
VRDLVTTEGPAISFPVGYHELHPDVSVNFQMNRFYGWVGDDSMLTEMREAAAGVQDYPILTMIFLELWDKALARHETLKGAYYLRLAEFFLFTPGPAQAAHTPALCRPDSQLFPNPVVGIPPLSLWVRLAARLSPYPDAAHRGHIRRIRRIRQLHRRMAARSAGLSRCGL